MKEPHSEGVAHHADPESWGGRREVAVQALTGESAGRILSREIELVWGADGVVKHGRQNPFSQNCARLREPHAVVDLEHARTPSAGTREIQRPPWQGSRGRDGKPQGVIRR